MGEEGQHSEIYRAYLKVYDYALAAPDVGAAEDGTLTKDIELVSWMRVRFFLSYCLGYILIWGVMTVPQLFMLRQQQLNADASVLNPAMFVLVVIFAGCMSALLSFTTVRRFHEKAGTVTPSNAKLPYETLYPKRLRRRLLWVNVMPFIYLTFGVVPFITRVQHLLLNRTPLQSAAETGSDDTVDTRVTRFRLLHEAIQRAVADNDLKASAALPTLRVLFVRRVKELEIRGQVIAVMLSSLGIAVSLAAIMSKDPIMASLSQGNVLEGLVVASIVTVVAGLSVYLVSQLQISASQGRDLRTVLDVLDVITPVDRREASS